MNAPVTDPIADSATGPTTDRAVGEAIRLRVYLAGGICLERGTTLLTERSLPGRQGRLVFAMLAGERHRSVSREEIAEELWPEGPPPAWEMAVRAIVSKLRTVLEQIGLDGTHAITQAVGCYQLHLPPTAWVDLEAAADAAHRAERDLRDGRLAEANGWAVVACAISRRPLLAGDDGPWATRRRMNLQDIRVRALECRGEVLLRQGDLALSLQDAEEVLAIEPFRESAYRLAMRAQAAAGNRAEALRIYERCRRLLTDELGTGPDPATEHEYLRLLRTS